MKDLTWLWRLLAGSCIGVALGLSGWALQAIADMPRTYTTKEEVQELRKENREDHREIAQKIDKVLERIFEMHTEEDED